MKHILALSVPFISLQASADALIVKDGVVYSSPVSKTLFPQESTDAIAARASFFKFEEKYDPKNGASTFTIHGAAEKLPSFQFHKTPEKPKIPNAEGCGQYPMEWLRAAKAVGGFKLKDKSKYVEVPEGYKPTTSLKHKEITCPRFGETRVHLFDFKDASRFKTNAVRFYEKEKAKLAYAICPDGLNSFLMILQPETGDMWKLLATMTVTDNCP